VGDLALSSRLLHEALVSEPGTAGSFELCVLWWDAELVEIVGVEVAGLEQGEANLLVDRVSPVALGFDLGLEIPRGVEVADVAAATANTCRCFVGAISTLVALFARLRVVPRIGPHPGERGSAVAGASALAHAALRVM
jgi:hypothetical protein